MKAIKEYPQRVQRNLDLIKDAFYDSDKGMQSEIRLLAAALRSLDFCVSRTKAGLPNKQWSKSGAPWVDIESPFAPYMLSKHSNLPDEWWLNSTPVYQTLRVQIRKATLEAKIELLKLIEEFYRERNSSPSVWLTFAIESGTRIRLHCQGAKEAALPENKDSYPEWLDTAQAEMQAFAEFLCTKVPE